VIDVEGSESESQVYDGGMTGSPRLWMVFTAACLHARLLLELMRRTYHTQLRSVTLV
jgi:hypothetical protein